MYYWQYYGAGRIVEAFNRREWAIELYQEALRLKPGHASATNRIAYLLAQMGKSAEAEPYFRAVLEDDPGNAVAHFNLGFSLEQRRRFAEAIVEFREAVRLKPTIDRAWYGLGLSHAHLGQHEEAAKALHEAATLQPMNPHAWYALGMAYHSIGARAKFNEVARHLVRFDPRMTRRLINDSGRLDLAHLVQDLVV